MNLPQDRHNYWMRAVSFTALLHTLHLIADFPDGLTAGEIDAALLARDALRTRRNLPPARTTLYHYRNTLLRLGAVQRVGSRLRPNRRHAAVCELLRHRVQENGLDELAHDQFANLVLGNHDCRRLFFDLFLPSVGDTSTAHYFRRHGHPVTWRRDRGVGVIFKHETGTAACYGSPSAIKAVLYGLRYWARDELSLIDEYGSVDGTAVMFPIRHEGSTFAMAETVLSLCTRSSEWSMFAILDLITRCCVLHHQPIARLYAAIRALVRAWPGHIALIPTSRSLATLTSGSPSRDELELRRYFTNEDGGPYISHIRVHREVTVDPLASEYGHDRLTIATPALV